LPGPDGCELTRAEGLRRLQCDQGLLAQTSVPVPSLRIDPDEILEFCRLQLAGFRRPQRVCVVEGLPKTTTGKVQRAEGRELIAQPQAVVRWAKPRTSTPDTFSCRSVTRAGRA
jgi:acyl-CoA synthetase (AMP-forming)/AMP-acid ligase II